jgi:hypothetical protein
MVEDVGFRVHGSWFMVYGLGCGLTVEGLGLEAAGLEHMV